jgi:putative Holliday junction resolvase
MPEIKNVIALDVGDARIGVSIANTVAKIARPLTTLTNDNEFLNQLIQIIDEHEIQAIVVGLPRGLNGQSTEQTKKIEDFVSFLKDKIELPFYTQDEALTSKQAEYELKAKNKPYTKEDIDALAATLYFA